MHTPTITYQQANLAPGRQAPGFGLQHTEPATRELGSATISVDPDSVTQLVERSSTIAIINGIKTYAFTCEVSPLSATEQGATITVLGIEVTQTVQQHQSTNAGADTPARLVAGKETLVRAYLDPGLSDPFGTIEGVTGSLTFQFGGKPVSIDSMSPPMTARDPQFVQRRRLADTLNFVIPSSFANGSFSATITAANHDVDRTPDLVEGW